MSKLFDFNGDGRRSFFEGMFGLHIINSVLHESRRGTRPNPSAMTGGSCSESRTPLGLLSDEVNDWNDPDRFDALGYDDDLDRYDEFNDDYDDDLDLCDEFDDDYDDDLDCCDEFDDDYDDDLDRCDEFGDDYDDDLDCYDEFDCDYDDDLDCCDEFDCDYDDPDCCDEFGGADFSGGFYD